MITLQGQQTLQGVASVANKLTVSATVSIPLSATHTTTELFQGQLGVSPTVLISGVNGIITDMQVVNTDSSPRTFALFVGGAGMGNQILPAMTLDAGGMAVYGQNGWQFFDATGALKSGTAAAGGGFTQVQHDALPGPHHAAFTTGDHAGLPNPHHTAFVQADHDALPNPHHLAFTQANHDALPNPHHAVLNLAAVAPPKALPGAASVIGNGTNAAKDNHSHQESGGVASRSAPTSAFNTTETQLVGFVIPAGLLAIGSTFRLTANGTCTSTAANAATFRCRIGSTTLTGNIAVAIAPVGTTTAASAPFMVDLIVTVRTIGAGGTVLGAGVVMANSASGALQAFTGFQTLATPSATVAVDTTANKIIELTAVTAAVTTTLTVQEAVLDWTAM